MITDRLIQLTVRSCAICSTDRWILEGQKGIWSDLDRTHSEITRMTCQRAYDISDTGRTDGFRVFSSQKKR